jgi:hypothetical protein
MRQWGRPILAYIEIGGSVKEYPALRIRIGVRIPKIRVLMLSQEQFRDGMLTNSPTEVRLLPPPRCGGRRSMT